MQLDGVQSATVRGRWMGRSLILEVEAELDPEITLLEADDVGRQVEAPVLDAVPEARQIRWIARPGGRSRSPAA
jgi:divalent metal cation (Fe/Co/Zn/Cd) transporter